MKTEKENKKYLKGSGKGKGEKGDGRGKGRRPRRFFNNKEGCSYGRNCLNEHGRFDLNVERDRCIACGAKGHKASDCTRPKEFADKPKSEENSSENGNWRDRAGRPTGTSPSRNPMPGSRSGDQESTEDGMSTIQEPDPESEMNVTLKRLMKNPNMTNCGKEPLNSLATFTKSVGLKMVRTSRSFQEEKKNGCVG